MKLLTSPFYYFCLRIVHLPAALSAHKLFITLPCRTVLPISALGVCWEERRSYMSWADEQRCVDTCQEFFFFKAIISNSAAEDKIMLLFLYLFYSLANSFLPFTLSLEQVEKLKKQVVQVWQNKRRPNLGLKDTHELKLQAALTWLRPLIATAPTTPVDATRHLPTPRYTHWPDKGCACI